MLLIVFPLLAVSLSLALHGLALWIFPRLGLMDFPERYGLKRPRLPYPTGLISVVVFLLLFLGLRPHIMPMAWESQNTGVVIGTILLAAISFRDDRTTLPPWLRLGVQLLVAFIIFAMGSRIYTITSPFGGFVKLDALTVTIPPFGPLPVFSGLFTVTWLTLTINALNWFDGIPGQVSVLSSVGFLLLGALALLRTEQPDTALLAFTLAGISLGAMAFEFPRTRVVIGDTGTMFFGLMMGLIGIYQGGKVATAFLILSIPLFDALLVILHRIAAGSSPLLGNRDHLHHRLLAHGWSTHAIILLTACIGATFGTAALLLNTQGKALAAGGLFLAILVLRFSYRMKKKG